MKDSTVPFRQAECRIVYGIDAEGEQVISTTYETDGIEDSVPDYFTGLVMFEAAKINFLQRHGIIQSERP